MEEIDFTENEKVVITDSKGKKTAHTVEVSDGKTSKKLISCLRNEKIIVKFVPRQGGLVSDPKHILYGGMSNSAKKTFVVPVLQSGIYVNVLTNAEKDFLEEIMQIEKGALSVYKKNDNFWANKSVSLGKENTILDLSIPDDYIKYKILLANKDFICPSEEELKRERKATYQFVISKENADIESSIESLNTQSKAFLLYGTLKDDLEKLSVIVELATGKVMSRTDKKSIYAQVEHLIRNNPKEFIKTSEDPYLNTKILIFKGVDSGVVRKRNDYYYLADTNQALCGNKEEPTLEMACVFLNAPRNQEVKFTIEGKIK
jgi:hypothetical protein